jgi:hypothetical protein
MVLEFSDLNSANSKNKEIQTKTNRQQRCDEKPLMMASWSSTTGSIDNKDKRLGRRHL